MLYMDMLGVDADVFDDYRELAKVLSKFRVFDTPIVWDVEYDSYEPSFWGFLIRWG